MNDVSIYNQSLPTAMDDLSRFVLVGREKLNAVRAEIRAIDKVGLAKEVREQKLREGQDIGEAVLDAETRIGELMKSVPKASGGDHGNQHTGGKTDTAVDFGKTKAEVIEEAGFTPKQVERFQQMADNPDLVAEAKAEARENDSIVTQAAVLNKIEKKKKETKKKEREEKIAEQIAKPKTSNHVDIYTTDKKYRVIYADPPWSYNDKQNTEMLGGAEKHYPTMALQDICDLPIPAEDNAVLFMWVTAPMLEDSFKVVNAWGFKYKTNFVWDKVKHNMGHYSSVRHELLFVCTKGSCLPDINKLYDSVVSIEREEHSRKPEEFRNMIDVLYPVGDRIELFAREAPDGWDVWGNMA